MPAIPLFPPDERTLDLLQNRDEEVEMEGGRKEKSGAYDLYVRSFDDRVTQQIDPAVGFATSLLLTDWSFVLMDALADAGIRDVVISPGSRSTPFVIAALQNPRLRCIHAIDERSAAFFALGQARWTGVPSLLLCTSGSAGAHYFPAVIESSTAHVPLLILTADRPPEAQWSGANQTVDQGHLYGHHARLFLDLGPPHASAPAFRALRRKMVQAYNAALQPIPGTVHINAPARKPLEPVVPTTEEEQTARERLEAWVSNPATRVYTGSKQPNPDQVSAFAAVIQSARHGLIVCGPASKQAALYRDALVRFVKATGFWLYAESTSQHRFQIDLPEDHVASQLGLLLTNKQFRAAFRPDVVLQIGAPPTCAAWEAFCADRAGNPHLVVTPHGWPDPASSATLLYQGDVEPFLQALTQTTQEQHISPRPIPPDWSGINRAIQRTLDAQPTTGSLTEPMVCALLQQSLPPGSTLLLGNSLPVRTFDVHAPLHRGPARVLSQRGASGIDGLVSGATGTASVCSQPLTLLVGDVSFLHDLSGLTLAQHAMGPLVLVVIQNQGGRIFEQLPILADQPATAPWASFFTTPHAASFRDAAACFQVRYRAATTAEQLAEHLQQAYASMGCTLIEAVVPPHSAAAQTGGLQQDIQRIVAETCPAAVEPPLQRAHTGRQRPIPAVLLHGFLGNPSVWDPILPHAWEPSAFFCPPLVGHHPTATPAKPTSFVHEVDRLASEIRARFSCPVHLVGYSMGGRLALGLLCRHPDLFSAASVISAHPGLATLAARSQRSVLEQAWVDHIATKGLVSFVDFWESYIPLTPAQPLSPDAAQRLRSLRLAHDPQAIAIALQSCGLAQMPDLRPWIRRLTIPVHWIAGQADTTYAHLAADMSRCAPAFRSTLLPDCGHNPLLESPETLQTILFADSSFT